MLTSQLSHVLTVDALVLVGVRIVLVVEELQVTALDVTSVAESVQAFDDVTQHVRILYT